MLRNVAWAVKGNLFYALSQWVLLVILAKFGGPELVGRYSLGLVVTAPIVLLTSLQLRSLLASDFLDTHHFSDYVRLRIITSAITMAVLCGIVLVVHYSSAQAMVILLIGVAKILESGSDILYGMMQKRERMDLIGGSKIVKGGMTVLLFGSSFYATGSLVAALSSMILTWLLVLALFDCRKSLTIVTGSCGWISELVSWDDRSRERLVALFWQALPLGIVSMLISYTHAVPRYLLESYHGEQTLGYFSGIAYFSIAITLVVDAVGQTAFPRLAAFHETKPVQYWRLLRNLSAGAFLIGAVGISMSVLVGKEVLDFFYTPEFSRHHDLLVLVMVLGTLEGMCSILGVGLTAARMLNFQVPVLIVALSTTALAGWRLIPEYGTQGAVWAAILGVAMWTAAFGLAIIYRLRMIPRECSTT